MSRWLQPPPAYARAFDELTPGMLADLARRRLKAPSA